MKLSYSAMISLKIQNLYIYSTGVYNVCKSTFKSAVEYGKDNNVTFDHSPSISNTFSNLTLDCQVLSFRQMLQKSLEDAVKMALHRWRREDHQNHHPLENT